MKSLKEALVHKHMDANTDLPLKYENILVPGNVVTIEYKNTIIDHIVITRTSCKYFDKNIEGNKNNIILIDMYGDYWNDFSFNEKKFPYIGSTNQAKIIGIRKVIPIYEIRTIESKKDIEKLFQKYRLKHEIS